jgi:hypothetical protein
MAMITGNLKWFSKPKPTSATPANPIGIVPTPTPQTNRLSGVNCQVFIDLNQLANKGFKSARKYINTAKSEPTCTATSKATP